MASDTVILGAITVVVSAIGTGFGAFMSYKMAQLKTNSDKQVGLTVAAHDASTNNSAKIDSLTGIAATTLVHVNDQFLIQLRLYKESTRTIALLTKLPEDIEKADMAEKMFKEHEEKQSEARQDRITIAVATNKPIPPQPPAQANTIEHPVNPPKLSPSAAGAAAGAAAGVEAAGGGAPKQGAPPMAVVIPPNTLVTVITPPPK